MLVTLGEEQVKTLEDFAGCAADELTSKEDGILKSYPLEESDASAMIMSARVALGWLTAEEAFGKGEDEEAAEEGEAEEAEAAEAGEEAEA